MDRCWSGGHEADLGEECQQVSRNLRFLLVAVSFRKEEDCFLVPWLRAVAARHPTRLRVRVHLQDKKNSTWTGYRGYFDAAFFSVQGKELGQIDNVLVCGSTKFKGATRTAVEAADLGVQCQFI
jgi:ferredoxin-NADP reductase